MGIAPYGRATRVRSYNVSLRRFALPPSQRKARGVPRLLARRGDAPQGYLFCFASLRGHRPLRNDRRKNVRRSGALPRPTMTIPPSWPKAMTPQLRFAAQPSVHPKGTCFAASTGPPHRGRRGVFRACGRGGAMRTSPPTKSQGVRRITMGGQSRPSETLDNVGRMGIIKTRGRCDKRSTL